MVYQGAQATDDRTVVKMLADFFKSVYEPPSQGCLPDQPPHTAQDLNTINFSSNEVLEGLTKMDGSKGPGPDGIPLSMIFNQSIRTGIFPSSWKTSHITPIYKKKDRNNIENYRSVCIQKSSSTNREATRVLHKKISSNKPCSVYDSNHKFNRKWSTNRRDKYGLHESIRQSFSSNTD